MMAISLATGTKVGRHEILSSVTAIVRLDPSESMSICGIALFTLLLLSRCGSANPGPKLNANDHNQPKPPLMEAKIVGQVRYVALGDSTGAGVGAREGGYVARLFKRIAALRPGSTLTNLCVSGATAEDVLRDRLESAVRAKPNLVTLGVGINDVGLGIAIEEFAKNYDAILSRLRSDTDAVIVIVNVPDVSTAPRISESLRKEHNTAILRFNQGIAEIASRHGVRLFDIYTPTHEQLPSHPEFFSADGFHPSDNGYELWAERMWPTIALAIGADADAPGGP
jgi:acyl-CoA thioesterase I